MMNMAVRLQPLLVSFQHRDQPVQINHTFCHTLAILINGPGHRTNILWPMVWRWFGIFWCWSQSLFDWIQELCHPRQLVNLIKVDIISRDEYFSSLLTEPPMHWHASGSTALHEASWQSLIQKCLHFDEICITGSTGSCHFDNYIRIQRSFCVWPQPMKDDVKL